jgi:NTP pyrophosphatase (non-canonical NTP hydrolase)
VEVFKNIRIWAEGKNLIKGSTWDKQYIKLAEEKDELMNALMAKDVDSVRDELGDCVVVLTVIAAQQGLTLEECVQFAYNKISKRKGTTVDGIFIKDGA